MNEHDHKRTLAQLAWGIIGGASNCFADNFDGMIRSISFYGGAIIVILTLASICFDLRRKWKHRNDP